MKKCFCFPPQINENSKILILGSMPGVKSLEMKQYYAHPQNRFWRLAEKICNCNEMINISYEERIKILLKNNIAVWDVLGFCERDGSSDSDIKKEIPNDIPGLLKKYPGVKKIIFNGNKSYSVFKKYFPDLILKYDCAKMPSTSPANARFSLDDLYFQWFSFLTNKK